MIPEFSRPVRIDTLGGEPRLIAIEAGPAERAALAGRFGLVAIDRLSADVVLSRSGETVTASGTLRADVVQSCVATAEPVPAKLDEAFTLVLRPLPPGGAPDEEVELSETEMDIAFYDGAMVDAGEVAAETLSLILDPYPRAADAERTLREAGVIGEEEAKPAGALAGLKDLLKPTD